MCQYRIAPITRPLSPTHTNCYPRPATPFQTRPASVRVGLATAYCSHGCSQTRMLTPAFAYPSYSISTFMFGDKLKMYFTSDHNSLFSDLLTHWRRFSVERLCVWPGHFRARMQATLSAGPERRVERFNAERSLCTTT